MRHLLPHEKMWPQQIEHRAKLVSFSVNLFEGQLQHLAWLAEHIMPESHRTSCSLSATIDFWVIAKGCRKLPGMLAISR